MVGLVDAVQRLDDEPGYTAAVTGGWTADADVGEASGRILRGGPTFAFARGPDGRARRVTAPRTCSADGGPLSNLVALSHKHDLEAPDAWVWSVFARSADFVAQSH